ncbi:MAG: ABC transporter ATP-binding protein [bacterium]|nr:ABC transporter ATP-binding protein [bacterium]
MVTLIDIVKIYDLGKIQVTALNKVSLTVEKNEFVAIMGASGSGKSTLMNIIGCLDTFNSGSYFLDGTEVSKLSENELAEIRNRKIGFVFQTFNLLPKYNALQNVELPMVYGGVSPAKRRERAFQALERVGLKERWQHRPNELSGGERQRVAIARALVNNPAILLADEPTGNLDSQMGKEIMETFARLHKEGMTIILVTHEADIAAYAFRNIRLFDGKIIKDERK